MVRDRRYQGVVEDVSQWWAVEWHSRNRLDGDNRHVQFSPHRPGWPQLFPTRRECQVFIDAEYGYIRRRPDLRSEPHGWRLPRPARVIVGRMTPTPVQPTRRDGP